MTGDVLLIKRHHRLAALALARIITELKFARPVVAISGESGSGKSELSHALAKVFKAMGIKVKVVTTDDFYLSLPAERTAIRLERGIALSVGPQEYDWSAIYQVTDAYLQKLTVTMPSVDLLNDQVDRLTVDFSQIDLLIFDGLYAINNQKSDIRILIDIPYTKTKLAQLKRGKEPMDPTRLEILKAEHQAVVSIRKLAHYFITDTYKIRKAE